MRVVTFLGACCHVSWCVLSRFLVRVVTFLGACCHVSWCVLSHFLVRVVTFLGACCHISWCVLSPFLVRVVTFLGACCHLSWCVLSPFLVRVVTFLGACCHVSWCVLSRFLVRVVTFLGACCHVSWCVLSRFLVRVVTFLGACCHVSWCVLSLFLVRVVTFLGACCHVSWCVLSRFLVRVVTFLGACCHLSWCVLSRFLVRVVTFLGACCHLSWCVLSRFLVRVVTFLGACFHVSWCVLSPFLFHCRLQKYLTRYQTAQPERHREQSRRLSHDLCPRSHNSQSPDGRGHLRHGTVRREKRTLEASCEKGNLREKRRREDEQPSRSHRHAEVVTRQRSQGRHGDSVKGSSRGHVTLTHQYMSPSQHSASPRCDSRLSDCHSQSPATRAVHYHSDPDLRTSRSHHNRDGDRDHGSKRQDGLSRNKADIPVKTCGKSLLQEEVTVGQQTGAAVEGNTCSLQSRTSDQERMRAYMSLAQKRALAQQIAFKNGQQLRNRMIADYSSRSADYDDYIASVHKARDADTNGNPPDSETMDGSCLYVLGDGKNIAELTVSNSVVAEVVSAPDSHVTDVALVKSERSTKAEPAVDRSVINENMNKPNTSRRVNNVKPDDTTSLDVADSGVASVGTHEGSVVSTGSSNTDSLRTARDMSHETTCGSRVGGDDPAPLGMLLSVLKQSCNPRQQTQHAGQTSHSPPVASLLNMLFGQRTTSSPGNAALPDAVSQVSVTTGVTGEENTSQEHTTTLKTPGCLSNTDLTVPGHPQSVQDTSCVPSPTMAILRVASPRVASPRVGPTRPRETIRQDLNCGSTVQRSIDKIVIDSSKLNATSVTCVVEQLLGDTKPGKTESQTVGDTTNGSETRETDIAVGDTTNGSATRETDIAVGDTTNGSETRETDIAVQGEHTVSSTRLKDQCYCADRNRKGNKSKSNVKRHKLKHKNSSTADRNTVQFSREKHTIQCTGSDAKERTKSEPNEIPTAPDSTGRATVVSDSVSCSLTSSQHLSVDSVTAGTGATKPTETTLVNTSVGDDTAVASSDFAFVIDTNVSPVSSDVDDSSVNNNMDEDLWDISLQSNNNHGRGHRPRAGPQRELVRYTEDTKTGGGTADRTHSHAARGDVTNARVHVHDPRAVVKSREHHKPDKTTLRRRDNSQTRQTRCAVVKSKPSSRGSLSKAEHGEGPEKKHCLSDQHRRMQTETRENRRPVQHQSRPQKDGVRRHSNNRPVAGGTIPTTQKANCRNGRIAPNVSTCKRDSTSLHYARQESGPQKSVSVKHDHKVKVPRTELPGKKTHRDDLKHPLLSAGPSPAIIPSSPATVGVLNDTRGKDTPARPQDLCAGEQNDSVEEGEILSDEDPASTSDVTAGRRPSIDPRGSVVDTTQGHGTSRDRPLRHGPRRRPSHFASVKR